jgi:hypothetical protein
MISKGAVFISFCLWTVALLPFSGGSGSIPGYTSPAAGIFLSLVFDRVVTVDLNSGHAITGALAESRDNQFVLFEPWNKGSPLYHVVPLASIILWSGVRGEDADPLFHYNRQYLTQPKIREQKFGAGG